MDTSTAPQYLLQDSRGSTGSRTMFWALGGSYTSNIDKAERFTRDEAFTQHKSRISDIPWPLAPVEAIAQLTVDCQYVKDGDKVLADPVYADAPFVVNASAKRWDGNDLFFTMPGGSTVCLDKAETFSRDEALRRASGGHAWPLPYLQSLTRRSCDVTHLDLKVVLGDDYAQIEFPKPEPKYREQPRCESCKVFLSLSQFWSGCCPKCGSDSRP